MKIENISLFTVSPRLIKVIVYTSFLDKLKDAEKAQDSLFFEVALSIFYSAYSSGIGYNFSHSSESFSHCSDV